MDKMSSRNHIMYNLHTTVKIPHTSTSIGVQWTPKTKAYGIKDIQG